ncbi:ATPase-like, ParA/MinD [Paludibacter propionicigenes WB4]|uniref:Iron-sulfur cluster carrier protein n=1 Tax=Paludibacter propionicigenes (strain DSM 17365 / JCM 13257 / WB4) TaxID=694427 RepID=E4T743_PALPW|nr:Mrp/NBP35 family ATP-binding protein [Paludibacter propionicigenes]ADQ80537.1 ATPase-like, ParA/MinD [Paludibacter propionicigenes WB4]
MTLHPQLIFDALVHVRYPGTGKDIVSSGMVQDNIQIQGNKVTFSIFFEKPNDPFAKSVVKAAEQAILTYISEDIDIKGNIEIITKEVPKPKPTSILPNVKNIIAVSSGKGGVGKSTISCNLAISLAALGYKVGLLDADIHGPSIPKMFGVESAHPEVVETEGRHIITPIEKYGVKILSIGFFVDPAQALVWRGAVSSNALKQLITDADWGELDFFVMDLPPGTGDIHLTLVQTMGISGAIVVTTPQEVALADARKGVNMFTGEKVNVPVLGIVENMAWFTPAELPENKYYIFGKEGGKRLAEELNVPLLGQIPLVQSIREGGDSGRPISVDENSILSLSFRALAQNVVERVDYRNKNMEATKKVEMSQ